MKASNQLQLQQSPGSVQHPNMQMKDALRLHEVQYLQALIKYVTQAAAVAAAAAAVAAAAAAPSAS